MDSLDEGKICCKSYIFKLNKNHAIDKINWISLMRLYKCTCKEAGFELSPAQPCHHPSVKKDIIPTPPHPTESWKRLLAVPRISTIIRQRSKYLKTWFMFRSVCMYHIENSITDHVTGTTTGVNIIEVISCEAK